MIHDINKSDNGRGVNWREHKSPLDCKDSKLRAVFHLSGTKFLSLCYMTHKPMTVKELFQSVLHNMEEL